jgi:very-short-patch-repair endonuclease
MPKKKRMRGSRELQQRAQQLRRAMTPAERKLWERIRRNQLGVHIRKQHAVERFILDFLCAKRKLAIEVDGDYHADPRQAEYDAERTRWLNEQRHYRVIRFTNAEVMANIDGVLARIVEALNDGEWQE